jgi:hypothetical protein
MYDRQHEVIESVVDDLNVAATIDGLTIRLETTEPEEFWPHLDITWATLSEWYARLQKQQPDGADPMVVEAQKIHDDHVAALGGTYQECRSPSCWAARKVMAAAKGVSIGQRPARVRAARPRAPK